ERGEVAESNEADLRGKTSRLVRVQLQVEPETQGRALARQGGRLLARRPGHEQARGREDRVAVCSEDPTVDPSARPEVIPGVDEPRARPLDAFAHEDVGRPEVAVEERIRPGGVFEDPGPSGYLGQESDQPLAQTVWEPRMLWRSLEPGCGKCFERGDRITHVR